MLVLRRRVGEAIAIGGDIEIEVIEISRTRVKLGVRAPRAISGGAPGNHSHCGGEPQRFRVSGQRAGPCRDLRRDPAHARGKIGSAKNRPKRSGQVDIGR